MDGRGYRKWLLAGCLAAGALGCNRNTVQSPLTPNPSGTASKPSLWSGGSHPTVPGEAVEPVSKGPPRPETLVAFADVQLESAYDEKLPPSGKQELLDRARQGYQKALEQDPKNKSAQLGLARYYTRVGEKDRAVEVFKKYLTGNPSDKDVAHEVAKAHAQWKDWTGAVAWCDFALKIDPENMAVRKTMAFCHARDGKWEEGFRVMCQVMPEAQARYLMARVLEHQNQLAASRQQLHLALKADPNYAEAREFLVELEAVITGGPNPFAVQQAGFNQQP